MSQTRHIDKKQAVIDGKTYLGIEFGSTRIKSVLIDDNFAEVASGSFEWENKLENGIWTYSLNDAWAGIQRSYKSLTDAIKQEYDVELKKIGSIGISGMMHGYIVLDKNDEQLVPFRTWRNTITEEATAILMKEFDFNIPQRWSIAHLYQSILNGEDHVKNISHLTTLGGYIHWKLSGEKVLGVGEASGVFPIDSVKCDYDAGMIGKFDKLVEEKNLGWKLLEVLPKCLVAGESGGVLSAEGAKLIDPSGLLESEIAMCPPEGDAGTGMVATNSVRMHTGNVSAGTSVFAMIVLDKKLSKVYEEIDIVTTPSGSPVAMVHCNNFTSDLDAWIGLFDEVVSALGYAVNKSDLYAALYNKALEGDADCGGLLSYNFLSGEHIVGFDEGRPLFVRTPDSKFDLANFIRMLLFSAMGTLRIGMDTLTTKENVVLDQLLGHGGLFKTKIVGQRLMAAALKTPIVVMQAAGEGGAWGIALLGAYMAKKEESERLEDFLDDKVFAHDKGDKIDPVEEEMKGFDIFLQRFKDGLPIERSAINSLVASSLVANSLDTDSLATNGLATDKL